MLDDEEQLLRAVQAEPESDGARLVYADWLGDRGDLRGELITTQCTLEQRRTDELVARSVELISALPEWTFRFQLPVDQIGLGEIRAWSRGFVPARVVRCTTEAFRERKDELFRLAPCARELSLWAQGHQAPWREVLSDRDVVRWPGLAGVPLAHARLVSELAHVDELRRLRIETDDLGEPETLEPLLESGRLPHLEALEIRGMVVDQQAPSLEAVPAKQWRRAAFASELREFAGEMVDSLEPFPKLESYNGYFYGNTYMCRLVESAAALRTLRIGPYEDEAIEMRTLEALCALPLEALHVQLDRVATEQSAAAWTALDGAPLHTLALRGNWIDDRLVAGLAAGPRLPHLRALRIDGRARVMLDPLVTRDWPLLEELDLGSTPRPNHVLARMLPRCPRLRRLRCGVVDLAACLALEAVGALEVLVISAASSGPLPSRTSDNLRLLQIHAEDGVARAWASKHGFELWPLPLGVSRRAELARTFARVGPGFWHWASGFLL